MKDYGFFGASIAILITTIFVFVFVTGSDVKKHRKNRVN